MPNTVVLSVGSDVADPGKFYWDIKTAALDLIHVRKGFETLDAAKASLEEFRQDVAEAAVIENQ